MLDPPTTLFGRRREPPSFYRAVVAYAFHDFAAAEKLASEAIRSGPGLFEVISAHVILVSTYGQEGRYREALSESQFLLARAQDNLDLKSWAAFYAAAMLLQPTSVARRQFSRVPWIIEGDRLSIPVSMNGKEAHYGVDTGADLVRDMRRAGPRGSTPPDVLEA